MEKKKKKRSEEGDIHYLKAYPFQELLHYPPHDLPPNDDVAYPQTSTMSRGIK